MALPSVSAIVSDSKIAAWNGCAKQLKKNNKSKGIGELGGNLFPLYKCSGGQDAGIFWVWHLPLCHKNSFGTKLAIWDSVRGGERISENLSGR